MIQMVMTPATFMEKLESNAVYRFKQNSEAEVSMEESQVWDFIGGFSLLG